MNSPVVIASTTNYREAQEWAKEVIGDPNILQIWIPESGFVNAERTSDSISFTRKDDVLFGFGVGAHPYIDPTWERFSLPRSLPRELTEDFTLLGRLNVYAINSSNFTDAFDVIELNDADDTHNEINAFLDAHAPGSSSRPGDPQSVFWCGIRSTAGELLAVATIARWESGGMMLSSVATHTDQRRQGLGSRIVRGMLAQARERGIHLVALGVDARNTAAISIYEQIGFDLLCAFNTYSAAQEVPSAGNSPVNK